MDIILIPGLWLDGDSWNDVIPHLERAGHRAHTLPMPGLGVPTAEAADIGMAEWIDAAVRVLDTLDEPAVVVGHSGGGNVAWGVADARPDHVARVVFVDTVPPASDQPVGDFEAVDGVVPFPGWDAFPEEDVFDLDEGMRARTAPLTKSIPAKVTTSGVRLTGSARFGVPVTLLMGGMDRAQVEAVLAQWGAFAEEFHAIRDVEIVRIGSGHWPQFSVPGRLAELIDAAISR